MVDAWITLMLIVIFVPIGGLMLLDNSNREKVKSAYNPIIWDEQDYFYVVEDKKTKKQYNVEFGWFKPKFKEADMDWRPHSYQKTGRY